MVSVGNRGCAGVAWSAEIKRAQRACRGNAAGGQRRAGSPWRRSGIDTRAEVVATRAGATRVRPAAVSRVITKRKKKRGRPPDPIHPTRARERGGGNVGGPPRKGANLGECVVQYRYEQSLRDWVF